MGTNDGALGLADRTRALAVASGGTACGYAAFVVAYRHLQAPRQEDPSRALVVAYFCAFAGSFAAVWLASVVGSRLAPGFGRRGTYAGHALLGAPLAVSVAHAIATVGTWAGLLQLAAVAALAPLLFDSRSARSGGFDGTSLSPIGLGASLGGWFFLIGNLARFPHALWVVPLGALLGLVVRVRCARWRTLSRYAAPCALLPFACLLRNPSFWTLPLVGLLGICVALGARALLRRAGAGRKTARRLVARSLRTVDRVLPTFAVLGALSVVFLPFGFRDLPTADHMGHEAQHLGWLNSMSHGCLPFADCGFIYGPLREVSIFALSRGFGGLTLEHVRMSHIALTSVGVLLLIACLRTISGNLVTFLSATWLLLFHTALVSFVVYDGTYSLGWSDTLRAALPCAALVFGLRAGTSPLRIWAAGIAAGLSCLYSHDFGFLAIGAGAVGALVQGWLVPGTQGARARSATLHALRFMGGASAVLLTFALAYAAAGRGPRLLAALRWVLLVASGKAAFAREPFPIVPDTFVRLVSLYERIEPANSLGTTRADYLFAPLIPLAAAPILARRFAAALRSLEGTAYLPRFTALALFAALVFRHPFMSADGWHLANATAPSLLVLAMLLSETDSRQRWASTWRGSVAAAITLLWTAAGAHVPLAHRIERLTSGQERPSRGPRFVYRDLERAGDVSIPVATLGDVRALREATGPDGTLFATTWMLGGGLEAFLVGRPNPTGIDVPHEVASPAQQADLLRRMQAHPPTIIYGSSFEYFGPQVQRYIEANWVPVQGARLAPMRRYHGE